MHTNSNTEQAEKRQTERTDLETQLAREKMISPDLSFEQVKCFFEKFKDGDVNDLTYRRAIIDIFVSKIYLFDDKILIICNADENGKIECPLNELSGSPKGRLVVHSIPKTKFYYFVGGFAVTRWL